MNPKMQPCPQCGSAGHLSVYCHGNDWYHVECDGPNCTYLGPGEGSNRAAIKAHNLRVEALIDEHLRRAKAEGDASTADT